jgi:putative spermidine/putrescine transport system ATP-binding protein
MEMAAASQSADVAVRGLTKTYGPIYAAHDVSFDVQPGELLALLGPSGCGKTTTLRIIAGLIRPTAGSVYIKGTDVTRVPVHRRQVGMLFQNYALFPHMRVLDNVGFGLAMRRVPRQEIEKRALEALRLVRLDGFAERMPHQLSGGQAQRVALARAMVINPTVLLLDEPFGALDRKLRESMQIELRALQERLGITTVLVTHDQEEALTLANQIAVMRDGQIHQLGTPKDVYENPNSRFVADFIGTSNFFSARVTAAANGQIEAETEDGLMLLIDESGGDRDAGAPITIAVRPEGVRLSAMRASDGDVANAVAVRVDQVVYRGALTHLYLRRPSGQEIIAVRPTADAQIDGRIPAPLDEILVSWEARANRIVRDE